MATPKAMRGVSARGLQAQGLEGIARHEFLGDCTSGTRVPAQASEPSWNTPSRLS
jgi:hypothetical protein